jgi:hypothetical protein
MRVAFRCRSGRRNRRSDWTPTLADVADGRDGQNLPDAVPSGPVLLVDDMVDSRWTLTECVRVLRAAGSGVVWPLVKSPQPGVAERAAASYAEQTTSDAFALWPSRCGRSVRRHARPGKSSSQRATDHLPIQVEVLPHRQLPRGDEILTCLTSTDRSLLESDVR